MNTDLIEQPMAWQGDVLGRHGIGEFLYRLVLRKSSSMPGGGALCFALDGDWGTGKTFFVKAWSQDIERWSHPVIQFDAWANDLSEDPLLGFMAQMKASLEPLLKQLPMEQKFRNAATKQLKKFMKDAGKAVLPVAGVIVKAIVKKASGIDTGEVINAAIEGAQDIGGAVKVGAMTDAALDAYFKVAMKSHTEKQEAIQQLKTTIEGLLTYLESHSSIKLPLFVFIDELDRCRPDYAIRLLEGLKHLFDAKGVCFVVSTNLHQLSESVRAVYGAGFASYLYLKRFFSFEYSLPTPDFKSYARALVASSFLADGKLKIFSGLPDAGSGSDMLGNSFACIAEAFDMDLRSQQQVFKHAEAAATGLKDGATLHSFFLFFLTAVLHYHPATFESLSVAPLGSVTDQKELLKMAHFSDANIYFKYMQAGKGNVDADIAVSEVFFRYRRLAQQQLLKIWESVQEGTVKRYPDSIAAVLAKEEESNHVPSKVAVTSIAGYAAMVRSAGQIR